MWKRLQPLGPSIPSVRNCHSMDTDGERLYIFGGLGVSSKERFNELWIFSVKDSSWTLVEPHGDVPTPRYCCTMNSYQEKMVCFGGFGDGDRLNTVHAWSTENVEWKFLVPNGEMPEKRSHHSCEVAGQRLLVFGGLSQEGKRLNDMHSLDLGTAHHSLVSLPGKTLKDNRFRAFLVRAQVLSTSLKRETDHRNFTAGTLTWSSLEARGNLPAPRLGHSCVMLNSNVLVLFGGYGGPEGHTKYNEIHLLHFDTMMWTQPIIHGPLPPPMYAHRALAIGDKMLVFGGDTGSGSRILSNDLWLFDLPTLRWTQIDCTGEVPPPRSHFGAIIAQNQLFVFGGSGKGESEKLNDLFSLDLASLAALQYPSLEALKDDLESTCDFVYEALTQTHADATAKETRSVKKLVDQRVVPLLDELRAQYSSVLKEKDAFGSWSQAQLDQLHEQEKQFFSTSPQIDKFHLSATGRVILNVGGSRFHTTMPTLTRDPSTLLASMFSGRYPLEVDDEDHSYFIDRDPTHFRYCLNYLRDNTISLPPNRGLHLELLREASYYQISGLVDFLRSSLRKLDVALEPNGPEAEKERMKGKSKLPQ